MTMQGGLGQDFISDVFGQEPKLPFFSELNQRTGLSPNQRVFFENQFDSIFNKFLGQLGGSLQGGTELEQLPKFQDFIKDFDFEQDFFSRPPSLRFGGGTARFAPPTRFLFNRR